MYEIERILRERRHARHGYPIIRNLNEADDKLTNADYKGYHITHNSDAEDYKVYAPGATKPSVSCETYTAATRWIDSQVGSIDEASYDDDPEETNQEYTSAATSINSSKLPAIFKLVKFESGSINLDYGGGRFDNVAEYLKSEYDATNLVYDPYNRTAQHNQEVLSQVRANGGADTVTCSNVLNVIKEPEARATVIRNCKKYLKSGGTAYFTVYEGTGKGNEGPTKSGYQLNRKTATYVEEIEAIFSSVQRKGQLIIARG